MTAHPCIKVGWDPTFMQARAACIKVGWDPTFMQRVRGPPDGVPQADYVEPARGALKGLAVHYLGWDPIGV